MKISEVFSQLTHGELSQLSLGGAEAGKVTLANYPILMSHLNLGLTALYSRFPLKEGRLVIEIKPGIQTYLLNNKYAVQNFSSVSSLRYILDTSDAPFNNDVLKVEQVLTEDGTELGLNDESDPDSCFTPSSAVLRVPSSLTSGKLTVVYRANHPVLALEEDGGTLDVMADLVDAELELPYSHLEPLLLFVASRVHNPIGMSNEFHAGNSYAAKYEKACQLLEVKNLQVDQGRQNTRLYEKGWV